MSSKHRFSVWLSVIWIFIWMFFYVLRQNYANAQKDFTPQQNFDLNQNLDKSPKSYIVAALSWIVDQSKKKYKITFDLDSDSSFQRYLSDDNPFSDPTYKPLDLAPIVSYFTYNKASNFSLRATATTAFADMAWAFRNHFDKSYRFYIVSAYRSYWFQNSLLQNWCEEKRCAEPWSSEHQAWLALDIAIANKNWRTTQMITWWDYYKWMSQNAYKYWFHNTYQKWIDIDGKMVELRHRRFVGIPFATYLHDNNMTIAEYFRIHNAEFQI